MIKLSGLLVVEERLVYGRVGVISHNISLGSGYRSKGMGLPRGSAGPALNSPINFDPQVVEWKDI